MRNRESIIEDITMALAGLYSYEYDDIDILSEEFQEFLNDVETFLQVQNMKYIWRYWSSVSRYVLSLNHKPNTYWI